MFVIVNIKDVWYRILVAFMNHLSKQNFTYIYSSSDFSVIAIKPKAKHRFRTAAMLLFYIFYNGHLYVTYCFMPLVWKSTGAFGAGIALCYSTGLRAGWLGVRVPARAGNSFLQQRVLGPTQHTIQWVPGALSVGVRRSGRKTDDSLLSSAEVKNTWSYTSTPSIHLHGVVLI
jgi:hypothetical protein